MDNILKEWLRIEFYKSNIPKYKKYFDEWINNITENQIDGFEQQRIGQLTKNKYIWLDIKFKMVDENTRQLVITPHGNKYEDLCERVL